MRKDSVTVSDVQMLYYFSFFAFTYFATQRTLFTPQKDETQTFRQQNYHLFMAITTIMQTTMQHTPTNAPTIIPISQSSRNASHTNHIPVKLVKLIS